MSKFSKQSRLGRSEEQDLLLDFFRSLSILRGFKEATQVFQDLLSRAELTMLAKRLKIAKLLLTNATYQEIARQLKVSPQTIARVNIWLQEAGDGFRLMFYRTKKKSPTPGILPSGTWSSIKRRYPMYFWPELLIREIMNTANKRQKQRLRDVVTNLNIKDKRYRELQKIMNT
ncbi:TPA: hypothetical protein DIC39_00305 [Patescibacteria group bacterium]|nr:hypothetical protein [Patescibacteria group bacterium]